MCVFLPLRCVACCIEPVVRKVEAGASSGMSQDDQAMSRAIEASLSYNMGEDTFEELPLEEKVRKGDT